MILGSIEPLSRKPPLLQVVGDQHVTNSILDLCRKTQKSKIKESEMITIDRPVYLKKLISKMDNGMIKVITGVRRCGKSFLLFDLF